MGKKREYPKAAIDIGSNTVLLLVGRVIGDHVETIYEEQHAPRLGKKVDADKNLHPDSMAKVIDVLIGYKSVLERDFKDVKDVLVTATSAVRDAANKHAFLKRVKEKTGFKVQVLSGEEEAAYTFFGAKSVLADNLGSACVIDIGGGSTEVALGNKRILTEQFSYNIGSVRFTERYLQNSPPSDAQIDDCRSAVNNALKQKIFYFPSNFTLIGVAGTVTSLAHIDAGLNTFSPKEINGIIMPIKKIDSWVNQLKDKSSNQLLGEYPEILKGRADVFLGGLLILQNFMRSSQISEIVVSTGGIRHGALIMNNK